MAGNARLRRIKSEFRPAAFRVRLCFAASLLVRSFESAQTAHFFQDSFRIQLVLQPLQGPVYRLTFTNNHFRHVSSSFLKMSGFRTGAAEPTRGTGWRQLL